MFHSAWTIPLDSRKVFRCPGCRFTL